MYFQYCCYNIEHSEIVCRKNGNFQNIILFENPQQEKVYNRFLIIQLTEERVKGTRAQNFNFSSFDKLRGCVKLLTNSNFFNSLSQYSLQSREALNNLSLKINYKLIENVQRLDRV